MGTPQTFCLAAALFAAIVCSASNVVRGAEADVRIVALVGDEKANRQIELRNGDIVRAGTRFRLLVTGPVGQSVSGHYTNPEGLIRPLSRSKIPLSDGKAVLPADTSWYQIERESDGLVSFDLNFVDGRDATHTASTALYYIADSSAAYRISKLPEIRGIQTLKPKPAFIPVHVYNARARAAALRSYNEQLSKTRGNPDWPAELNGEDAALLDAAASGIVLVVSEETIGAGVLLSADGLILTNFHVIAGNSDIGVFFRPRRSLDAGFSDVVSARVEKIDQVADLALLRVQGTPGHVRALEFAALTEADVGIVAHNIGHTDAKLWAHTYVFASSIQKQHEWLEHIADVIHTGTPVNPQRYGGALVTDEAKLIGFNSFGPSDLIHPGANFAISATELERFLNAPGDRFVEGWEPEAVPEVLQPPYVALDTNANDVDDVAAIDYDGNGILDTYVYDENEDGILDFILVDRTENGTSDGRMVARKVGGFNVDVWEFDEDGNGTIDVIGFDYDQDGQIDRYRPT